MSTDAQYLKALRSELNKRLQILELKKARKGSDVEPHILLEIDEIVDKIAAIDAQLSKIAADPTTATAQEMTPVSDSLLADRKQIQLVLEGSFDNLTIELQNALTRAIAAIVDIRQEQIRVLRVSGGSIIFWLELPTAAAQRLLDRQQSGDPILAELGIQQIKLLDSAQIASLNAAQPTGGFQSALEQIRMEASRALDSIMIDTNNALEGIMARMRKTLQQSIAGAPSSPVATAP